MSLKNKYLIILILLLSGVVANAQRKMPVVVLNDTMLAAGTYFAENNILVSKEATLRLAPGSKIILAPGVVIRIEGGFEMLGSELSFAEITSEDENARGLGLVVSEISKKNIALNKVRLHGLELPIEFDQDWHRNTIEIKGCEFKENESYMPGIFVRVPENIEVATNCDFVFEGNSYIDNIGGIYFENVDQLNFNIKFTDNFIYGNRFYGAGREGMLTAPLFFRTDNQDISANFEFTNNTLSNNFILDSEYDTVIHEVNMGVAGSASKVNLPKNYYGNQSVEVNTKNLDHFSNNNNAPFINISPMLKQMPGNVPPVVGNVHLNGENIGNKPKFIFEPTESFEMEFEFDKDVDIANSTPVVAYTGLDSVTEKEITGTLDAKIEWVGSKKAIVRSADAAIGKLKVIFVKFSGIVSASQYSAPSFYFGENGYRGFMAKNYGESIKNLARYNTNQGGSGADDGNSPVDPALLAEIMARQDSLEDLLDKMKMGENTTYEDIIEEAERQIIFAKFYKGSFEFGPYIGSSIYFGDFTGNDVFNPSDASLSIGAVAKYNFNERMTIGGSFIYGSLEGDESDNLRGTGYPDRGFQFRSPLLELSTSFEYNLNKLGFGDQGRFTPALSIGVGYFYFNPQGYSTYLASRGFSPEESWINLYDYRTAGLPLDQNYSRAALCIPFGLHIKSIIKNRVLLDFSFTWRATFSDLIDDFGEPGVYRDYEYFVEAFKDNPTLPGTDIKRADVAYDYHRSLNPTYHRVGSNRFGSFNDWYIITGVTLTYIRPQLR
ncbi:MAG: hypothetical protein JXQ87_16365 [Bacteroidia bacterium]